ncbi:TetR/AcrR family transcriptional regulator [Fodinicola feengrottensis]|uniref:TetR/AcrR family transcriptional regulator n=1 Tax=Fodinicola feengrottensis TaxID=435914 RepID=UPI0013D238B7|nr:TetR/AcrR family transcriptional regulator [Fodinicola feengrottensis]
MSEPTTGPSGGRERIRRAAYDLFSREGTRAVGVDAIIARAGVAMTLYRNFASKDDLILDFLEQREQTWTKDWLQAEVRERASTPRGQLLAIFDTFSDWFVQPDFEGCAFLTIMVEINDPTSRIHQATVRHLANIRIFLSELAEAAGAADPDAFARKWHILMKGSIMAAHEGDTDAGRRARELGELFLQSQGILADEDRSVW